MFISLVIILADQITKSFIVAYLAEGQSVPLIGSLLRLTFIYNEGGALGTSLGPSWTYTILTLIALFLIVRYFVSSRSDGTFMKISLALILGGAVGNLIDRLRFGRVVDFIDMDFPNIPFMHMTRWYTYNIADAAITIGLILFGLSIIFRKSTRGEPASNLPEEEIREAGGDPS
jgi:signal peptidase II